MAAGNPIAVALQQAQTWLAAAQRFGGRAEFDRAVAAASRALALATFGAPERFPALITLADVRAARFEALREVTDLSGCARLRGELVALARADHPEVEGNALLAYAHALLLLGIHTGARRAVEQAALTAKAMTEHATATGDIDLHAGAAEILRQAVPRLPADHPDRAALAALRGVALVQWMDATGDLRPLGEAAEEAERAVRLCRPGDANLLPFLSLRDEINRLRYESERSLETLDAFLESTRAVLDRCPPGDPIAESKLTNLGQLYRDRYRLAGDPADLDHASHHLRLAVGRTGDPALREIARTALDAVAALRGPAPGTTLPPGLAFTGTGLAEHLTGLTDRLRAFERTGDVDELDRICQAGRTLLAALPDGSPQRWMIAMPLGPALMRRYEAHGEPADLDEAVELLRTAVTRPVLNPDHVTGELINLAAALINRFLRDRSGADLDEAVTCARRAIESVPPGDPARGRHLNTLGTALLYRFQHSGRRFDLDDAIETGKAALAAADTGAAVEHARANLGNRLRQRFHVAHDPADLDEAIEHLRAASGDPSVRLNLALTLADRHNGPDDLREAVRLHRSVLASTPARSPLRGPARLGLAEALAALGRPEEAAAALDGPGVELPSQPFERMDALVLLARIHAEQAEGPLGEGRLGEGRLGEGHWTAAADAYARAVAQLPVTVWRGLPATDRNQLIARWWDVACDAAAAAIAAGAAERAVEMLDHGRSLWWSQVLDARTDQAELAAAEPELARRLAGAASGLEDAGSPDERLRRVRAWEEAVAAVRARPGSEHFLAPTPFAELAVAAVDGPVVLVNVSRYRCDALVVHSGRVRVVPLPRLSAGQADERTRRYLDTVGRTGVGGESAGAREQGLLAYLEWLWDVIAQPVFDALPVVAGSRLWWCATGPLALAPLHAAGYHDPDDTPAGRTVLDRVVSSATPTLRALRHARRPHRPVQHRPLVVAVADRPGYATGLPALPAAAREAERLRTRFPTATVLTDAAATRSRVTALLGEHTCVHFACHGDAGEGALCLTDGRLTLPDLARLDLPDAHLAVLTACHTAMGDTDRPDEAGHLAAALQVVGYRHVVSTLWAIADDTAAGVADQLYEQLTPLDPALTADALHAVILQLRDQDPYRPTRWAPFLHYGA